MKNTRKAGKMTDSELIAALTKDWLDRDGDTFVKIRRTARVGWEETLRKGAAFSSYLLDAPTPEDLFVRAYPLAKQTISAMDAPYKVNVRITADRSCTENRNVYVATDYFDDPALSTGEKLDIFLGLTVHEGCHLLYTDFPMMGKAAGVHPLCANILNIIEDERVERILGEEKPGLANYLGVVKEHYFGRYAGKTDGKTEPSTMAAVMNSILGLVRFPKMLHTEDMTAHGELLLKVKEVLTPYPASTLEAEQAAERIFALIKDEYEEGKTKKNSGGGTSPDKTLDKDYAAIMDALSEVASAPVQPMCGEKLETKEISSELLRDGGLLADICEGRIETGTTDDVLFHKATENADAYNRALAAVKQYVPAIRRTVKGHSKEYKLVHLGMRSGLLDTNKLAEAVQGAPTVYKRNGEVKSDTATVCVLVDESGSMIREGRMTAAKQTAVLLNEALAGIPNIELFFYGHSADEIKGGTTDLRIYRENNFAPRYALGSLEARDNNRDGKAILETARRVRRQTDNEVLMFVISDGAPAAQGYIGREAIAHTKACVEKAEAMGFHIVQICINASYDPSLMFRHHIKMENLSTLAHDLGRVITKTLTETIKSRVV